MKNILITTLLAGSLLSASSVFAAPFITGTIGFDGLTADVLVADAAGTIKLSDIDEVLYTPETTYSAITSGLGDGTAIQFAEHPDGNEAEVESRTGSFSSIVIGTEAEYSDFGYDPLSPDPVDPLWSVDGFEFEMDTVLSSTFTVGTGEFLVLNGLGTISHANYENTQGDWSFSTQTQAFTWSASTSAVPEPSTYAMFGTAFAILGFVGYRKRRA